MFKRTILALAIAALAFTGVAQAQENATFTLRSGDQVTGQLMDLGGVGFTVKINGVEKQIPTNDVAAIDFAGGSPTADDWAKATNGQHVISLKSGDTVSGQLYDVSGSSPLKITFKTASGEREFASNEIARIILARPTNAVATSGANPALAPATGAGISVSPKNAWTPTGLTVRKGEMVTFNATGEVQLSTDQNDIATPFGSKAGRKATNAPLPDALAGALIGRIGNGQPFAIGSGVSVPMPAAGQLFLGINDDGLADNQGEYKVDITRTNRR